MQILSEGIVDLFVSYRLQNNLSLREMEKQMEINSAYLSRVESRRVLPSNHFCSQTLKAISQHFEKKM